MNLFKLKGVAQNYDWGGTSYLSDLIGSNSRGQKFAEYWMGAHDRAPSQVEGSGEALNDLIRRAPVEALGDRVHARFGCLPFLFKILDVNDLLSIQVHPSKAEAEKGFVRENEQGVSLGAAHRNYKDDNHKPEIMVALSEFWLLHGFKPEAQLLQTLQTTTELSHLTAIFQQSGYRGLYEKVMEESVKETNRVLKPLIERVTPLYQRGTLAKSSAEYWAVKAHQTFCEEGDLDKGIYSIFFFNIVKVNEGEAIFQDAGVPHAYMHGQNIELMANSDNVLRGGLTPKHIDVAELLKHISFEATNPNILYGEAHAGGMERIYRSPAPDFELSKLDMKHGGVYQSHSSTFEIMIVIKGQVNAMSGAESVRIKRGEVLAVMAGVKYEIESEEKAMVYKAKCP
ncbi:mannose-6-phosphate isomerase, class I [Marinoscillum sp.]|uniref:mannose-6-phosphate isomerase, class I n=1 Tax=Marinoscillum sp. TaxID=2024838 RepID=UPI003BAA7799